MNILDAALSGFVDKPSTKALVLAYVVVELNVYELDLLDINSRSLTA
jgi:hypothetical protein